MNDRMERDLIDKKVKKYIEKNPGVSQTQINEYKARIAEIVKCVFQMEVRIGV